MDLKKLTRDLGLNYKQVATMLGYKSSGTISDVMNDKDASEWVKARVAEVLEKYRVSSEIERKRMLSGEPMRMIDEPPGTTEFWRLRAIKAEERVEMLEAALQGMLTRGKNPSSVKVSVEAQAALDEAEKIVWPASGKP